jgi:hydroxyacylglutathione hydrolase
MIDIDTIGDITRIRMSREIAGNPVRRVAAYLVDGLLIDTGCHFTAQELVSALERHPPTVAVNTHYHEDHIGANRILRERFGIDIFAHRDAVPLIARPAVLFPYQETVWGYPEPAEVFSVPPVIRTGKYAFEVIEAPGHSPDHICLVERWKGWCFCGDLFPGRTLKTIRPEEDMETTVVSLRRLASLETKKLVLFTSTGRVIEEGREALTACARFIEELSLKAKELDSQGRTVQEIVTALFGGEDERSNRTNGQFSTENLIRSVLKMHRFPHVKSD